MKKMMLLFGMVFGLVLVGSVQASWTMQYDATLLPGDSGSIVYDNGTTASFGVYPGPYTTEEIVSPDIFHLNTIDKNGGRYYNKYIGATDRFQANGDDGYVVEMRAKLINTDESGFTSAALLDCEDGRRDVTGYWALSLSTEQDGKNYVRLAGEYGTPKTTPYEIGTDFHVFNITVVADAQSVTGYTATLKIDGNLVGSVATEDSTETHQLRFGDLTGSADANWEVDYIYGQDGLPVPEPATIGLLVMGIVGLIRRK